MMNFSYLKTTDPYYNLAIEEYLLKYSSEEYFLLWQNEPTVVIGKNQNAFAEINVDYTNEHNIHIARRITGGGAVYHDLGTLNYSYISNKEGSEINFERFSRPIIEALENMGITARLSGRNDIMVGEKKISGNAQTHYKDRVLHHGTLLFDTDIDKLSGALRPDQKKIQAKAIKSVRSRVANIKSFLNTDYSVLDFLNKIKCYILTSYNAAEISINSNDKILELARRNSEKTWIFPDRDYLSSFSVNVEKRYNFGNVSLFLQIKNDVISDVKIEGDFFGNCEIRDLEGIIIGKSISKIDSLISGIEISDYIFGMTNEEFISLIKI